MNSSPGRAGLSSAQALQPIPYRTESAVTADKALCVFAITVALLVAALGVLLWARKRGWLQQWQGTSNGRSPDPYKPRILSQTRLGPASQVFVLEVEGARFLLVESTRQISLQGLAEQGADIGERA